MADGYNVTRIRASSSSASNKIRQGRRRRRHHPVERSVAFYRAGFIPQPKNI